MPDINKISQVIKTFANSIGYDFFPGQGGSRKDIKSISYEYVLSGAFQLQKGDNRPLLNLVVAIKSDHFRVSFRSNTPKKASDLNQLLDFIGDSLPKNIT